MRLTKHKIDNLSITRVFVGLLVLINPIAHNKTVASGTWTVVTKD